MKRISRQKLGFLNPIKNQKGQMAIFVALIFQILFVLFAMSINVALVVHDKINLQNSVDFAAYYGAQRQAEHLNVMAHMNYQIRQAWKLLTWRYRVMGTLGVMEPVNHPQQGTYTVQEVKFLGAQPPVFCVAHDRAWTNVPDNQNLCKNSVQSVEALTIPKNIAGFNPINQIIQKATETLRTKASEGCDGAVASSFWLAATIMKAFREDQANRKAVIYALAKNMERPGDEIVDIDGSLVRAGVEQVILKNLTHGNRDLGDPIIDVFNSLEIVEGTSNWLAEIQIDPEISYTDAKPGVAACMLEGKSIGPGSPIRDSDDPDGNDQIYEELNNILDTFGGPDLASLRAYSSSSQLQGSPLYNYSLGFEKNPWNMIYFGVKATLQARQLFFPLGQSVRLRARAFAKPFGGRMGPWVFSNWSSGSKQSSGGANQRTDPLTPPVRVAGQFDNSTQNDPTRYPNFSRFPGDQLGLDSRVAQAEILGLNLKDSMRLSDYKVGNPSVAGESSVYIAHQVLANNQLATTENTLRELAAIAPDLFDITYYSIEPNFNGVYLTKLEDSQVRGALGIPDDLIIRGDYGWKIPPPNNGPVENIHQTILRANTGNQTYHQAVNYKVNDRKHLLTSWIPDSVSAFVYSGEEKPAHFGECGIFDDDRQGNFTYAVPGSCLMNGGRTGYSVKMVSRDSLINGEYQFSPDSSGVILNPPPVDDGW